MHAFIIRPFGVKNGIDFDRVESELIIPALKAAGFSGGTTAEFIEQGNIRTDMFEQLLIADLIVADISIHNANVFYELGIRHAFRDRRSFLIKSIGDDVPFDIKTDRYLPYDAENPSETLEALTAALEKTWLSHRQDSPVFQLLPGLQAADPTNFLIVPKDFQEEVEQAKIKKSSGKLQLLFSEVNGFAWRSAALRLIGHAQFTLKDWSSARVTWEAIRCYDEFDVEANTLLGTVYQRLGDLIKSDQSLHRVLSAQTDSDHTDLAEIQALLGRNAKTRWEQDWRENEGLDDRQKAAMDSPFLDQSLNQYAQGFLENRNHYYSGLNALAMATIKLELIAAQPEEWHEAYEREIEANCEFEKLKNLRADLIAGVKLAIETHRSNSARQNRVDIWAELSAADLTYLSSTKPTRIAKTYKKALAGAEDITSASAKNQLLLYEALGLFEKNTKAALESLASTPVQKEEVHPSSPRVILFTGHRIDAPGRKVPRFPGDKENDAREIILNAVSEQKLKTNGNLLCISGCACGGDILFHEVCKQLDIPTKIYLAIPVAEYIRASVADGGSVWIERFKALVKNNDPQVLSETGELPKWLQTKQGYGIWQRSNLWMLHHALAISKDDLVLIALWNGDIGDDAGGTEDMVKRTQERGATFIHLDTRQWCS